MRPRKPGSDIRDEAVAIILARADYLTALGNAEGAKQLRAVAQDIKSIGLFSEVRDRTNDIAQTHVPLPVNDWVMAEVASSGRSKKAIVIDAVSAFLTSPIEVSEPAGPKTSLTFRLPPEVRAKIEDLKVGEKRSGLSMFVRTALIAAWEKSQPGLTIGDLDINVRLAVTLGASSPASLVGEVLSSDTHPLRSKMRRRDLKELEDIRAELGL